MVHRRSNAVFTPLLNIVGFEPDPDAHGPLWKGHMVIDHEGTRMRLPFWVAPEPKQHPYSGEKNRAIKSQNHKRR